ncbi:MAG: NAD-dependent epimerase/dehydratase family protein, partial [Deltaproteobacteria bacterium]
IRLDSRGPVFYLGSRVGKDSKIFKMYKLRTMIETPVQVGESICPEYDPRVTTFGRFLRRTKLNEFPQLINILKGDMTFVGPRPETPDLADLYPEEAKKVFSVTPGLVGPNQILGRNEEELYPPGADVKKYYIEKILPEKVRVDLEYIRNTSFFKDLGYVFLGVKETLVGTLDRKYFRNNRNQIYLLLADITMGILSLALAYAISFHGPVKGQDLILFSRLLPVFILVRTGFFVYFGMYNTLIRYISYHDIVKVLKSVTYGSVLLIMFSLAFRFHGYPWMLIVDWGCLILFLSGLRFGIRFYREKQCLKNGTKKTKRVLIFGAGGTGDLACRSLAANKDSPFEVVGFIDDAPEKYGKTLQGLKILGNGNHIKALAQLHKVEEIILAMPDASAKQINKIVRNCQNAGMKYRIFSSARDLGSLSPKLHFPIRTVELSDILPLKRIRMDRAAVEPVLTGKTVLITGSGGTLGLELCRRILGLGCKKLIIIERYEAYLTELVAGLLSFFPKESVVPVLIATDRIDPLEEVFARHRPDVVFHTSMKKYIPFFEVNNDDVAWINYVRTLQLTDLALKFQSGFFVMVSSIAACNNGNFISNSLYLAELCVQQLLDGTRTRPVIAR